MPTDPTDTRPCNPGGTEPASGSASRTGVIPGGGDGCLYRPVREEDVNVDLGNQFAPAIPPPPCIGDDHVIDQATPGARGARTSATRRAHAPLCDKQLVMLQTARTPTPTST